MILDKFPTAQEFYKTYWCKKPFIVRNFIPDDVMNGCIDGDEMAGLSLEEDIKSRIIVTDKSGKSWDCDNGPFEAEKFATLGENNWSLLVQNVEQYHEGTSKLLEHFEFSPRWLMDDIMISYSTPGGSVGAHTDSYHVFLIQGIGSRKWKLSTKPIFDDEYIDGAEIKVFKNGFDGEEFEVTKGDVIYIPPFFGHQGVTIDTAMTLSVGFLGPKLSEMFSEYSYYLEQNESANKRYIGDGLNMDSSSFAMSIDAQKNIQNDLISSIQSDDFSKWMAQYFAIPTHDDVENIEFREDYLEQDDILKSLNDGEVLYRPEHVKITITNRSDGGFNLSAYGEVMIVSKSSKKLIDQLNNNGEISADYVRDISIITDLYNHDVLSFKDED